MDSHQPPPDDHDQLSPADAEFARALRSLAPAPVRAPGVDAAGAAFAAGRREAQRAVHRWRIAAAAAMVIGAGSTTAAWLRPVRLAGQDVQQLAAEVPEAERVNLVTPASVGASRVLPRYAEDLLKPDVDGATASRGQVRAGAGAAPLVRIDRPTDAIRLRPVSTDVFRTLFSGH